MKTTIMFGGGCFWCTEAIFQKVKGVLSVESGYAGGARPNPTYEQVSTGATGHAEVIRITYDTDIVTLSTLLDIFFALHDPTTKNRQGADVGSQYRSIILAPSEEDVHICHEKIAELTKKRAYWNDIVTEVVVDTTFYLAEQYHQNYYAQNKKAPYCSIVIAPKVKKLLEEFGDLVGK